MPLFLLSSPTKAGILATIRFIASKLFFLLVTFPAVTGFLLCLASSAMSFDDLSRSLTNMYYESQQLGSASQPDRLRISKCVDPEQSYQARPSQVKVCANETITEVPVNQFAREFASALRSYYWFLVIIGFFTTILIQVGQRTFKRYSQTMISKSF